MARPSRPAFPDPVLVTDTEALRDACEQLAASGDFVTVDTEFMRERTYYPILCVVQLASDDAVYVVDAEANGLDLAPLARLMADERIVKVFHAARQDLEIFLHRFGVLPTPVFDTQVAAMVAGFGDQVGYDSLVGALTGGHIDKAHRFSDWSARPLSDAQVTYAAADVTHLRGVYRKLLERLQREDRLLWVREEMAILAEPATFRPDPETVWERLRPRSANRRLLGVLRAVAAWREREAQRVDIPRQRLLRDESLLELAAVAPRTADELGRIRAVTRGFAEGRSGAGVLAAIEGALALDETAWPEPATERGAGVGAGRASPALVSLLKVLLAAKCEAHDVAPKLLASSDDLDRLALGEEDGLALLTGWRRQVFGEDALALRAGRVAIAVEGRRIKLVRTGG